MLHLPLVVITPLVYCNHALISIKVTKVIASINSAPSTDYKKWSKSETTPTLQATSSSFKNGKSTVPEQTTEGDTSLHISTTPTKKVSDILG